MRDAVRELHLAYQKVNELIGLDGDPQPVAMALGQALGWRWPEDIRPWEASVLGRLCDLLNVNLLGRPQRAR